MRNNNLWHTDMNDLPVFGTIASQFNDPGMNSLYKAIMNKLIEKMFKQIKEEQTVLWYKFVHIFVVSTIPTETISF